MRKPQICIVFLTFSIMTTQMRKCAGVMVLHIKNKILLVVTNENFLNIPMGKADFEDHRNLKTTSLRELGEETI